MNSEVKSAADLFFESKRKITFALILIPVLLYVKSLLFEFSPMDEQWLIVKNAEFLKTWDNFKFVFSRPTLGMYYRPLFLASFMLDYHIAGASPFYYHLTNLIFHVISVLLVFRFLVLWEAGVKTAFALAVLFAVHPLMLQSVAWIPGRNDLLLCVFTLASLISLKNYLLKEKISSLGFHLLFFICALFTKENAIVLPFVYAAAYFTGSSVCGKRTISFLGGGWFAVALAWFFLRKEVINYFPPLGSDLFLTFKNFISANLLYVGKALLPVQQSVFPTLKNSSLLPGIIMSALLLVLCLKPGIKNKKNAFFGLGLFFGLLAIPVWFGSTSSSGEHYEHRVYTSMAGLCLFFSQLKINSRTKIISYSVAFLALVFAVRTFVRMDKYQDEFTYADTGTKEAPDYFLFYSQKADLFYSKGDYVSAIRNYDSAILYRPNKIEFYNNRGNSYNAIGKYKEAISDFGKVISGSQRVVPTAFLGRCIARFQLGQADSAMSDLIILKKCCKEVIPPELDKQLSDKWNLILIGKLDKQIALEPKNAILYFTRGEVYLMQGAADKAYADIKKAAELDPQNQVYKNFLEKAPAGLDSLNGKK